jgi:hypothetical protein
LVALVFAVSFAGGCVFMACAWVWLASVLDGSLATRTLLTALDVNVFIDIASNHTGSSSMFILSGTVLTGAAAAAWVGVNGIIVAVVGRDCDTLSEGVAAGLAKYAGFAGLWVAAMVAHAAVFGAAYVAARLSMDLLADGSSERAYVAIAAACTMAGLAMLLGIATIHDHARIRCVETGEAAWRCGLWACAYVMRERRALPLALSLIITTVLGWSVYQGVSSSIAADSTFNLTISLVWAQVFMAFRALVRVWAFASAAHLQSSWETS